MMKYIVVFVTIVLLRFSSAYASELQKPIMLSYGQIQALSTALQVLDSGNAEQCLPEANKPPGSLPSTPSSTPPSSSTTPVPKICPYIKSVPLVVVMARDMVVIEPHLTAFRTAQNSIRTEILADKKFNPVQQQDEFTARTQKLLEMVVSVRGLENIRLTDLNMGKPPMQNNISAVTLAQLAPIVSDLSNGSIDNPAVRSSQR